jgi:uncharacterized protein YjaG (DUF416 family)
MLEPLEFDEQWLVDRLEALPRRSRVAFACACAERLHSAHQRHEQRVARGSPGEFSAILARLWYECETDDVARQWAQRSVNRIDALLPHSDEGDWTPDRDAADAFAMALANALEVHLGGESRKAAFAGYYVYEVLRNIVLTIRQVDLNRPGAESTAMRTNPFVQAELRRQRRDLEELLCGSDTSMSVRRLREWARREPVPSDAM